MLRETYKRAFEQKGYSVSVSSNAQQAVMSCDEQRPDAVVLELQLRLHGGVEFLHELRSYPEWHDIPVILHTMVPIQSLQPYQKAMKQLGATIYTYKPATSIQKLLSVVADAIAVKI